MKKMEALIDDRENTGYVGVSMSVRKHTFLKYQNKVCENKHFPQPKLVYMTKLKPQGVYMIFSITKCQEDDGRIWYAVDICLRKVFDRGYYCGESPYRTLFWTTGNLNREGILKNPALDPQVLWDLLEKYDENQKYLKEKFEKLNRS